MQKSKIGFEQRERVSRKLLILGEIEKNYDSAGESKTGDVYTRVTLKLGKWINNHLK